MGDREQIYVTVRLVDGKLQLATTTEEEVDGILYPAGGGNLGPVLIDSKKYLGIEEQAVPILKRLFAEAGCDGDGFGDIDWGICDTGVYVFSWLGPNLVQWDPATFGEADRSSGARFREGEYQVLATPTTGTSVPGD
jgi:hypothetical protein